MKRNVTKEAEQTEYGQTMSGLAEEISKTMRNENQGYIFTVLPSASDDRPHFSSFGIKKKDYLGFWAAIHALITEVRDSIPEDDMLEFRKGFLPMVQLTLKDCFPLIHLEGGFYDEMEDNEEDNED